MTQQTLLYLSRQDVEQVALDMHTIIDLVEVAFKDKGAGHVEMPPRIAIHPWTESFLYAMPAYVPTNHAAGVKWVSGYPENYKHGLPYIMGLILINDDATGLPLAVMDCTWITAYRTGAATALAAKYLARHDSETAGILACGVQGRTNLQGLCALFPVKRAFAYDINREAQDRYVAEMSEKLGIEVIGVDEPRQAVEQADLVVTSGPILKDPHPTIEADWLPRGAFASAVDYASYWTPAALKQADKMSTDDHAQYQFFRQQGYFKDHPQPYADLGEIVAGQKPGRETSDERTIAVNLGLAIEDMVVAPEVYRRAKEKGIGQELPL